MILDENRHCLLTSALRNEPSGRLWNPPDESELNSTGQELKYGRYPPTPSVVAAEGPEGDTGDNGGTKVPGGVKDGTKTSAFLRVGKFWV